MKDVISAQKARSSCRKFKAAALDPGQLEQLKTAALTAPSGLNRQELHFNFITDIALRNKINRLCFSLMEKLGNPGGFKERMASRNSEDVFYGAPVVIVISGENTQVSAVNAGIAVQNLALAAEAIGLGSCIIGIIAACFDRDHAEHLCADLDFAEDEFFHIAIAIGQKDLEKVPHELNPEQIRTFS